jgi:hypothetical protein
LKEEEKSEKLDFVRSRLEKFYNSNEKVIFLSTLMDTFVGGVFEEERKLEVAEMISS